MGWTIGPLGFSMRLSPRVPGILSSRVGPWVDQLLAGAGLVVRSFVELMRVDRGYETENVVATTVQSWAYFRGAPTRVAFARETVERLAALPGVRSAGMTSALPLAEPIGNEHAAVQPVAAARFEDTPATAHGVASDAGYFATLGIPLLAGRLFEAGDRAGSRPVTVVNETLARQYWPGEDAVGKRLRVRYWGPEREMEVVGVVGDVRTGALEEAPPPTLYVTHPQAPTGALTFVVRTTIDPAAATRAIREVIRDASPAMPIEVQTTLETLMSESLRARRFHLFLLGTFSLVALALAGIGIFGVVSYTTRRRTREVGIRMALGARRRQIVAWVLRQGLPVLAAGLGAGLAATLLGGRLIESLLYDVEPADPAALGAAAALLSFISAVAMLLPARAAARTDPTVSVRAE